MKQNLEQKELELGAPSGEGRGANPAESKIFLMEDMMIQLR